MLLSQAQNLERIHEFHVVLAQSGLMKWCEIPYSFLAMTKPSEYSDESRLEVRPAHGKYLFVYPFVKTRAWYALPADERWRIMQEHIRLGREYPSVDLNTSYSFGLDDQEFVVAFETDNPADFLDLVQRLRTTESSSYTLRDTPTFTCISCSVERALGALDGAALTVTEGVTDDRHRSRRSSRSDFDEVRDVTVIGAGPVGMCTAFWAGHARGILAGDRLAAGARRPADHAVSREVDLRRARPSEGARPRPRRAACACSRSEQFDVPVHLNTTAATISWEGVGEDRVVVLHTDRGELRSRTVIVAGGHGAFEPKKLPGYDMTPWEGRGAHYIVGEKSVFEGKRVMIVGGGDSACDWVDQPARHGLLGLVWSTAARVSAPTSSPSARCSRRPTAATSRCTCRSRSARSPATAASSGCGCSIPRTRPTRSRSRSTRSCSSSGSRPRSGR